MGLPSSVCGHGCRSAGGGGTTLRGAREARARGERGEWMREGVRMRNGNFWSFPGILLSPAIVSLSSLALTSHLSDFFIATDCDGDGGKQTIRTEMQ